MVSRFWSKRQFDGGQFSGGFLFIIVPAVVLIIAASVSSAIRYAKRQRRRTTTENANTEDSTDTYIHNTISPTFITQLQNLSPEPYALPLDTLQRDQTHNLTPLPSAQLRYPYER